MFGTFRHWLASIAVEATKVEVKVRNDGERGLFAAQDIFAGERIIHLPLTALLTEEWIRVQGSRILKRSNDHDELSKEQVAVGMIEELRQMVHDDDPESSCMVHLVARSMQYQWRQDDAVSLYLIAARKLIKQQLESRSVCEWVSNEESTSDQSVTFDLEPVLVSDVVAVSQLSFENELENCSKPATDHDHSADEHEEQMFHSFLPYVDMLPESFPTSPLYFSDDILSRMEGTNCYEFTKRMLAQMEADWIQLSAILRAYLTMNGRRMSSSGTDFWDPDEGFEHYKWAMCNIYSRSTELFVDYVHQRMMVPLFDMMNHDFDSNVSQDMDDKGNMSIFAGSDIRAGSEIFLNYGNFPNEKLLLGYGFVVPSNPFEAVQIYAPISADALFSMKAQILKTRYGIVDPNAPHILRENEPIPDSLLCTLRLIGLQSESDLAAAAEATSNSFDGIISMENEYGALTALRQALHMMARRLALNLISDENLRAASVLGDGSNHISLDRDSQDSSAIIKQRNIAHCKILCRSEYIILQNALQELNMRLELLQGSAQDLFSQ